MCALLALRASCVGLCLACPSLWPVWRCTLRAPVVGKLLTASQPQPSSCAMLHCLADVLAWGGSGAGCVPACCCHRAKQSCWDPISALGAHPTGDGTVLLWLCHACCIMLLGEHNPFHYAGWLGCTGGQGWGILMLLALELLLLQVDYKLGTVRMLGCFCCMHAIVYMKASPLGCRGGGWGGLGGVTHCLLSHAAFFCAGSCCHYLGAG